MRKRDPIFYTACGIFAVGVVLAILDSNLAILFLVAAYLLRPTLHAFDLAERFADERQVQIHSRSGNIAFIAVMLAAVGIAIAELAQGTQPEEMYGILVIGIGARAVTGLLMGGDLRNAASLIIMVVGLVVALFIFISEGFSAPGFFGGGIALTIALLGLAARKYPRSVAAIMTLLAVVLVIFLKLYLFLPQNLAMWMVVICLLIAASCLYRDGKEASDESRSRSHRVRAVGLGIGTLLLFSFFMFLNFGSKKTEGNGHADTATSGRTVTEEVEIQGISCTGQIELYVNGNLKSCTLFREDTLSGQSLDKGTVVTLTEDGALNWCFLQEDTEIQGVLCRGDGHGFMTSFHPNGKLRVAWPARDQEIQGIPVKQWSFWSDAFGGGAGTYFWENGAIRRCKLSREFTIEGRTYSEGDILTFDENGKFLAKDAE